MKTAYLQTTVKCTFLAGLLVGLGGATAYGQFTFNSGSDGSYGPLNITSDSTLALPPDGIFRYTTIYIATNATLKFTPNALNTPVYLLATNDVTINGTIDVSGAQGTSLLGGAGGPGGFWGGSPGNGGLPAGDGYGPGAGRNGNLINNPGSAGYGSDGTAYLVAINGTRYGSPLLVPLIGGSGGAGTSYGVGGNGGGGALLIASSTRINVMGNITATSVSIYVDNCSSSGGFGSGGAVRLVAPIVAGTGTLNVLGGKNTYTYCHTGGGGGRIRIDCVNRNSMALNCTAGLSSVGANMVAIPTNAPMLDITQVAGTNITVGTNSPVFFVLPLGSSTNQTVTVQASNFGAVVPIRVVLTPDNGPSSSYDTNINNTDSPASVTVPVVVPVNVQVQVNAWTR